MIIIFNSVIFNEIIIIKIKKKETLDDDFCHDSSLLRLSPSFANPSGPSAG